jgi:glycine cleavage system H protein
VFSPVSGKVVKVNSELENNPGTINKSPYGDGWMAVIQMSGPNPVLMSPADYKASLATKSH